MNTSIPRHELQALANQVKNTIKGSHSTSVAEAVALLTQAADRLGVTASELIALMTELGIAPFKPVAPEASGGDGDQPVPQEWEGLTFRSTAELLIAQALQRAGVLFFANARCLFPEGEDHKAFRESDFLVMTNGRWGVLEVDGRRWHSETAADDHHRDRLFKRHGAWCVERFDAEQCSQKPDWVVSEFLSVLCR